MRPAAMTDPPPGLVRLAAGDAVVEIAPAAGGAIASFSLAGFDVLRPTPAAALAERNVRSFACYPLIPCSNRIAGARLAFEGREHALARNFGDSPHAIHGVGWQRAWSVASAGTARAQLALDHAARGEDAAAWPWPFRATQTFALSPTPHGVALHVRLAIENTGDRAFPFGLGWHPFFPKAPDTTLAFAASHVWENDVAQIPVRRVAVPPAWRFDAARPLGEVVLDHVFEPSTGAATIAWPSARVAVRGAWRFDAARELGDVVLDHVFEPSTGVATIGWPSRGLSVAIDADRSLDRRVVYVPVGRDFLAFEPASHMTDAFNRAARGERGTGTRILPPGASFSCTMRLVASADR